MNAEVRAIKTSTEQGLAQAYAGARGTLPGDGVIAALREDAFKRFDAGGLPHRRVEEWKYTDLRTLMREAKPLAGPADRRPEAIVDIISVLSGVEPSLIAIVNGRYAPEWSDKNQSDPGVTVLELFAYVGGSSDYR
jgi:Fe-S cluster assembly protein SufD